MLTSGTREGRSWTETFRGALIDSCGIVLLTSTFLLHARWWVVLCWILCSLTVAGALAVAHRSKQPEDYAAVNRLATVVLVVMTVVGLVSLK